MSFFIFTSAKRSSENSNIDLLFCCKSTFAMNTIFFLCSSTSSILLFISASRSSKCLTLCFSSLERFDMAPLSSVALSFIIFLKVFKFTKLCLPQNTFWPVLQPANWGYLTTSWLPILSFDWKLSKGSHEREMKWEKQTKKI